MATCAQRDFELIAADSTPQTTVSPLGWIRMFIIIVYDFRTDHTRCSRESIHHTHKLIVPREEDLYSPLSVCLELSF